MLTAAASGRRLVAVVVPLSDRPALTADEETSLRHLRYHLARYDTFLVAPAAAPKSLPGCETRIFADRFFGSTAAHRCLMLSQEFYESFAEYEFILIYHLDALVFSERLVDWCSLDYDYLGAPWIRTSGDPGAPAGFDGVGNGGFSLRRVSGFLRVLRSRRYSEDPDVYWARNYASQRRSIRLMNLPKKYLKRVHALNDVRTHIRRLECNEDKFWSRWATWYDASFRIAPVEVALRFAFEEAPRYCFQHNGGMLPFGCHAWPRYDRAFWEPHLLKRPRTDRVARR